MLDQIFRKDKSVTMIREFLGKMHVYKQLSECAFLTLIYSIMSTSASYLLGVVTQGVIIGSLNIVSSTLLFYALFFIGSLLIEWLYDTHIVVAVEHVKRSIRGNIADAVSFSELLDIEKLDEGRLYNLVNNDCENSGKLVELLLEGIRNAIVPIFMVIVMSAVNWRIAIAFLAPIPLVIFWSTLSRKTGIYIAKWKKELSDVTSVSVNLENNRKQIKAYSAKSKAIGWMRDTLSHYEVASVKTMRVLYGLTLPSLLINILPIVTTALAGAYLYYISMIEMRLFMTCILIAQTATQCLLNMPGVFFNLPSTKESIKRINDVLCVLPKKDENEKLSYKITGVIRFDNIYFKRNREILSDITLEIKTGEKIAVVGPTGSGKSTLMLLIAGLYKPSMGEISFVDTEGRTNNITSNSDLIILQQNTYIYSGTIKENLMVAKADADIQELRDAAKMANILDWIDALDNKWDSIVGEGGIALSEGQKQRLSLARVFLTDPSVLILDEPTSALDEENERIIWNNIFRWANEKTLIVSMHKLSEANRFDKIHVLENGRIIESGRHADLYAQKGLYYDLYNSHI